MKRSFEKWMITQERKKPNTAYQYAQSINKVSNHYSTHSQQNVDLFRLLDIELLRSIKEDYSLNGRFSDFGSKGNGTIRNAVATFYRYRKEWEMGSDSEDVLITSVEDEEEPINSDDNTVFNFSYERDLQSSMILQVESLFPGYQIYGEGTLEGVEYCINGKRIDLLLEHQVSKELLAVELKAGTADFKVFGQIAMYLALLAEKFPETESKGVIVCGEVDYSLAMACKMSDKVSLKTYEMLLVLNDYN
ncbi:endonuclease NucS domain-containing protein [Vibrio fluminensis]|uniref:endonuclease NucS domain-containing protein n=1 Tax=Vibrio fluminensis TaxID=2783614 RepID=UPI0018891DEB|nr:endonuclease NucS domain-containing protein [Vibrio fluminensis]